MANQILVVGTEELEEAQIGVAFYVTILDEGKFERFETIELKNHDENEPIQSENCRIQQITFARLAPNCAMMCTLKLRIL